MSLSHDAFKEILARRGYAVENPRRYPVQVVPDLVAGIRHAVVEQPTRKEPLAPDERKETGEPRIVLRITRRGVKLLDKDNLFGGVKYLCDALRYKGLIPDDDPNSIELIVTQEKTRRANCGTLIEIEVKT